MRKERKHLMMNYKQMYDNLVITNYFIFKYNLDFSEEDTYFDVPN